MNIQQKQQVVAELADIVTRSKAMILLKHEKVTVEESTRVRRDLEQSGAALRVLKNTLMSRALAGTPRAFLTERLTGPVAVAYTFGDAAALAKAVTAVLKSSQKFAIQGGCLGTQPIGESDVKALATLPPIETLRGMLLGALGAVPRSFLGVLQAPAREFVGVLAARVRKQG